MTIPDPLPTIQLQAYNWTARHWQSREHDHLHLDLDAPYQRGSVWTDGKRRNLIRSLIIGVPVGAVVIALQGERSETYARVVDGKQRIETVRAWLEDRLAVPGWWFQPDDCEHRDRDVTIADLTPRGQRHDWPVPGLEFNAAVEWIANPDYDPGFDARGHEDDPRARRWTTRRRTAAERLQAEAEVYLLLNFGGVPQTEADRTRAATIAGA